jgi:hypothetical protein
MQAWIGMGGWARSGTAAQAWNGAARWVLAWTGESKRGGASQARPGVDCQGPTWLVVAGKSTRRERGRALGHELS